MKQKGRWEWEWESGVLATFALQPILYAKCRRRERGKGEGGGREGEWKASVVNTLVTALWPGNIFCPMWNVAQRGVTFRSTFLVPDIRCQLHFGATLCEAIHHNALPYPWTVSLSDEHAYIHIVDTIRRHPFSCMTRSDSLSLLLSPAI